MNSLLISFRSDTMLESSRKLLYKAEFLEDGDQETPTHAQLNGVSLIVRLHVLSGVQSAWVQIPPEATHFHFLICPRCLSFFLSFHLKCYHVFYYYLQDWDGPLAVKLNTTSTYNKLLIT